MASPLPYTLGTVTLAHGSADIVGNGTGWAINGVRGGDMTVEVAGGNTLVLASVDDDTHATAATKWMGPSGTYNYAISLMSADVADALFGNRHFARIVGQGMIAAIPCDDRGTLAERDALDPVPSNGFLWLRVEVGYDLEIYKKVSAGWEGPFTARGPGGAPAPLASLTDLSDVTLASPADGKVLRYQDGQWRDAVLAKTDVGLGNADNTADVDKPVSTAQAARIDNAAVLAPIANRLVPAEPAAAAFDLLALAGLIRDEEDRAKSWAGDVNDKLVYASPSTKQVFNRARVLVSGTALRNDHDPATGESLGVRIEPQSTNLVRNPRGEGGAIGSTDAPTYWGFSGNRSLGVTTELVGRGFEDGIPYVDIRYYGTASAGNGIGTNPETWPNMVVAPTETWTLSAYVRLVGGDLTGTTGRILVIGEAAATGTGLSVSSSIAVTPTAAALRTQRYSVTRTISDPAAARITTQLWFNYQASVPIDFTLRFGVPAVEKLPYASSPVVPPPAAPAATTRAADDITLPIAVFPWNGGAGTLTLNGSAVTPILNGASDALDIAAMVAAAGATHLKTLTWVPS